MENIEIHKIKYLKYLGEAKSFQDSHSPITLGVIKVTIVVAAVVIGNQDFSVFISPKAVEIYQYANNSVSLATVHQILQGEFVGIFGLHHVKDLILKNGHHSDYYCFYFFNYLKGFR